MKYNATVAANTAGSHREISRFAMDCRSTSTMFSPLVFSDCLFKTWAGGRARRAGSAQFSTRIIAPWAIAPYDSSIQFSGFCLAGRPTGIKNARRAGSGGIIMMTHTPFREGFQVRPLAGLLAPGICTPFHLPIPISRDSGSTPCGRRGYQLQWRDRAGFSPASLFSPDISGQPNGYCRLLNEV